MDPLYWKALILGIVEGLTEFLPISSTGHLILASSLLGFNDEKGKVFEVFIQSGAMLAVVWEFRRKLGGVVTDFFREPAARRFALNIAVAFVPAATLGLLFGKHIKSALFHPVPVALAFVVGALVIIWAERRQHQRRARIETVDDMTWVDALKVGVAQSFALIPGTSRSGATIIGGMLFGLSRRVATEFSFYLAVPTLVAAGIYDMWKNRALFSTEDVPVLAIGFVASFACAVLVIRWLIRYVSRHDFIPFAWYRLAFGGIVLLTAWTGLVDWS